MKIKHKSRRFGCMNIGGALILIYVFVSYIDYRVHSILPYIERVVPYMNIQEVRKTIPLRFIKGEQHVISMVPSSTILVAVDVTPTYYLFVSTAGSISQPPAFAEVYFNAENKVVGLRYSSDSGRWRPAWGLRAGETKGEPGDKPLDDDKTGKDATP